MGENVPQIAQNAVLVKSERLDNGSYETAKG